MLKLVIVLVACGVIMIVVGAIAGSAGTGIAAGCGVFLFLSTIGLIGRLATTKRGRKIHFAIWWAINSAIFPILLVSAGSINGGGAFGLFLILEGLLLLAMFFNWIGRKADQKWGT